MDQEDLPAAAGADALTEALQAHGVLPDGRVAEASLIHEHKAFVSRVLRLRLVYDRSCPNAPATIILKTGFGETTTTEWLGGQKEIAFYRDVAPMLRSGVVPLYFGGHWDGETGAWHLLLEDLTETHAVASGWPIPPSRTDCEQVVAAHARLHAAWWDDPRLGVDLAYMMALHWFPDRRQAMEVSLLDHYHRILVAHGVSDYDRQILTDDYRWAVLIMLVMPPMLAAMKLPSGLWWNHLARITMAIEDLGCRELLG